MTKITHSESGFSLVEVMISSALLCLAIIGTNIEWIQQQQAQSGLDLQFKARNVLQSVISQVAGSASEFPSYTSSGSDRLTYVACFDELGAQRKNSTGKSSFTLMQVSADALSKPLSLTSGSGDAPGNRICASAANTSAMTGGLEAHVTPLGIGTNGERLFQADVVILEISNAGTNGKDARAYQANVKSIRQNFSL